MKLGVYTSCLQDRPLAAALDLIAALGLESAEVNAGGFIPAPHVPVDALLASATARDEYLEMYSSRGIALTALNVNGNPLHPDPEVGPRHSEDLRRAIQLASVLGIGRVVAMSGLPAAERAGRLPSWSVVPWDSAYSEALAYQWNEIAVPFWREVGRMAADADVKVAIEMHPHNVVFNPPTLERLVEAVGATHLGAELDPSHLFWQGIDPIVAVERLGPLIFHAAAKDTLMHDANTRFAGVLDDRFRPPEPGTTPVGLGGRYVLNRWPEEPPWEFVAVGRGHDVSFWTRFLGALAAVDPEMAVNIEQEDAALSPVEGLRVAAETLKAARSAI